LAAEACAAVAADIEERVQLAAAISDDDQRFARDSAELIVAGLRERARAPHAVPVLREDPLALVRKDLRRRVLLARHRARALTVGLDGSLEAGHGWKMGSRLRPRHGNFPN